MSLQQKISAKRLKRKVGSVQTVLIDEIDGDIAIGRSSADAPEIDGKVFVHGLQKAVKPGQFVKVNITKAKKYDLEGVLV
jgi:ribosomal protein S12 methylthiotransferase